MPWSVIPLYLTGPTAPLKMSLSIRVVPVIQPAPSQLIPTVDLSPRSPMSLRLPILRGLLPRRFFLRVILVPSVKHQQPPSTQPETKTSLSPYDRTPPRHQPSNPRSNRRNNRANAPHPIPHLTPRQYRRGGRHPTRHQHRRGGRAVPLRTLQEEWHLALSLSLFLSFFLSLGIYMIAHGFLFLFLLSLSLSLSLFRFCLMFDAID